MKTKTDKPELNREPVTITLPSWLRHDATMYGAKKGYGMSELVSRLLEKFVDEEKARLSAIEEMRNKAKSAL